MFPSVRQALMAGLFVFAGSVGSAQAQSLPTPEKPWFIHTLVANLWPNGYSEVWVLEPPFSCRVVSNVDFQVFGLMPMIETATAIHNFLIFDVTFTPDDVSAEQQSGNLDARGLPRYWPQVLPQATGPAAYILLPDSYGSMPQAADLRALDTIHQHYEANRARIDAEARQRAIDQQRIAAEEAARKAATVPYYGPPVIFKGITVAPAVGTPRR